MRKHQKRHQIIESRAGNSVEAGAKERLGSGRIEEGGGHGKEGRRETEKGDLVGTGKV